MKKQLEMLEIGDFVEIHNTTRYEVDKITQKLNGDYTVNKLKSGIYLVIRTEPQAAQHEEVIDLINRLAVDGKIEVNFKSIIDENIAVSYIRSIVSRFNLDNKRNVKVSVSGKITYLSEIYVPDGSERSFMIADRLSLLTNLFSKEEEDDYDDDDLM